MDILDKLTNRTALEQAINAKKAQLSVLDAEELAQRIRMRVVGQDRVIDQITSQTRRRIAGARADKPLGVFCFAGPSGTGKTHLAKVLAEELFKDKKHLHFFDMSQFGQAFAATSLFGSPKGYVGSQAYGALTAALRDIPDCVVLLDEFEKAHPEIHKRFLSAWNDGFVVEQSDGAKIAANQAIFICTTNAASRRLGELIRDHSGAPEELTAQVKSALLDAQFAPEVLSRIDDIFIFKALEGLDLARVIALEIQLAAKQYGLDIAEGGIDPVVLVEAVDALRMNAIGGVRDIARAIERSITDGLITARGRGAKLIRLEKQGKDIVVVRADAPAPAAPATIPEA